MARRLRFLEPPGDRLAKRLNAPAPRAVRLLPRRFRGGAPRRAFRAAALADWIMPAHGREQSL